MPHYSFSDRKYLRTSYMRRIKCACAHVKLEFAAKFCSSFAGCHACFKLYVLATLLGGFVGLK